MNVPTHRDDPQQAQPGLFADAPVRQRRAAATAPLAERLRPQRLDDMIGQPQLLAPGRPLRVAF
ncbi:MAG: hypothetical protein GX886_03825, partial [Comamonadaceae bacterium]|nr:hypothetical protein [Comamonadaceae bacterium]